MQQIESLAELAQLGQRGDSIIAHINPREASLLKLLGGAGTINERTGLPQFFDQAGNASNGRSGGTGAFSGNRGWGNANTSTGTDGEAAESGAATSDAGDAGDAGGADDGGYGASGWGMGGYSVGGDGFATGPVGFDSPGVSLGSLMGNSSASDAQAEAAMSEAAERAERALAFGNSGRTEGGLIDGGPLGSFASSVLSGLGLAASATPLGALASAVGWGNTALGALNSMSVTDTGSYGPSLSDAARAVGDAFSNSASPAARSAASADSPAAVGETGVTGVGLGNMDSGGSEGTAGLIEALVSAEAGRDANSLLGTLQSQPVPPRSPVPQRAPTHSHAYYPGYQA